MPKIVAKGISKTISNFPGCAAYAVGCAAYAAGCAAYVCQSENKTNSVQLSWSWN